MKYVIKSQQTVKPFSRTRKGKMERVKQFTRQGKARTGEPYKVIGEAFSIVENFKKDPVNYKQFIESGRNPNEWDTYRIEQNKKSAIDNKAIFIKKWKSGADVGGNDVINFLRFEGIDPPKLLKQALQDDDTTISTTSASGRGMNRLEAKKIHKFVSESMNQLISKETVSVGEPFSTGEKVKVWKGEHEGKTGEVVSTDGMDVKIKHGEGTITVPKHRLVSTGENNMKKSQEQVKPFTRTRKGKFERVKGFSRIREMAKYPKATDEASVHQFAKDHIVSKKKAREYLEEQKQHLKWERTHSGKFGDPFKTSFIEKQKADAWERAKSPYSYSAADLAGKSKGIPKELQGIWDFQYKPREEVILNSLSGGGKAEWKAKPIFERIVIIDKLQAKGFFSKLGEPFKVKDPIGEPISDLGTYGMASIEEDIDDDETEAVSPEGGTPETKMASGKEIMEVVEAKENINKLVDMSNTIIDDNAVSRMKDELNKLEIHNDWELQDYKDLVEFSEGELRDAKEKGYRSANEYWQSEMPGTITASSSRKIRKGVKLMTINEVLNLNKSKGQYDFGTEAREVLDKSEGLEKAVQVKGFIRTRKGKIERVKPHSREQAIRQMKSKEMLHAITSEYNKAKNAEKLYGKDMAGEMRDMHTQDAKDLTEVHDLWLKRDYDGAYNQAANMDTAARDNIPAGIWKEITNTRTLGEPYRTTKARPNKRDKLSSDLKRRGLVRGDWDVITQKQNEDGSLTLGIKAIEKYKTPSHIEADVFSETVSKPVGDMIKVRINSSGDILEVLGKPVGEPFLAEHKKVSDKWETDLADKLGSMKVKLQSEQPVSKKELDDLIQEAENWRQFKIGEPYSIDYSREKYEALKAQEKDRPGKYPETKKEKIRAEYVPEYEREEPLGEPYSTEERKQIANTILLQMGGAGKIKAMTGAKNFIALENGVSFEFPSRKGPNYVKVTLEPDDTYAVEFGKKKRITMATMAKLDPDKPISRDDFYKKLSEHKDIYFDQLKELFERETGLYLSFNKSVTSGEKYVVSLEKGRDKGGFHMARGGSMGKEEKASRKKEQDQTGEKTQAQERLSGYAKRRREEMGGGDSEEMAI